MSASNVTPVFAAGAGSFLISGSAAGLEITAESAIPNRIDVVRIRLLEDMGHLLMELQHRIKNHLQLMGAMLATHARATTNERIRARLVEAGQRLQVIASTYDNLYEPGALSPIQRVPRGFALPGGTILWSGLYQVGLGTRLTILNTPAGLGVAGAPTAVG